MDERVVADLIRRAATGSDPEALADLFDRTAPALWRLAPAREEIVVRGGEITRLTVRLQPE